jgi:hypothetical protein
METFFFRIFLRCRVLEKFEFSIFSMQFFSFHISRSLDSHDAWMWADMPTQIDVMCWKHARHLGIARYGPATGTERLLPAMLSKSDKRNMVF